MTQKPSIGRKVHYTLSEADVRLIDERSPFGNGSIRNPVSAGQVYPAEVVAVFSPETTTANLVVQLDGLAQYWATSRTEGEGPGTWCWPPRV